MSDATPTAPKAFTYADIHAIAEEAGVESDIVEIEYTDPQFGRLTLMVSEVVLVHNADGDVSFMLRAD